MHPSNFLLAIGVVAVAAQESPLEEYRSYLAQTRFTHPSPENDTVDFRYAASFHFPEHEVRWSLPSNITGPNMTRFDDIIEYTQYHLVYQYRTDDDDTPDDNGNNTVSTGCGIGVGGAPKDTFGGSWPSILMEDYEECFDRLVERLGDLSGWDDVRDLRGGKRFWFRVLVTPYYSGDDAEGKEPVTLESTKFDVIGVDGYNPGQEGAEWSSSDRLKRPVMLVSVVAAAVVAWML